MDVAVLLGMVESYGYFALFFCLFLGIVGLPINDETLVMLAGFVAATGLLKPLPALLVTVAGVLTGMNLGFFLGRWLGTGLLDRMSARSPRFGRQVERAQGWLTRYGAPAILGTYYIPGVRHVVPYLIGIGHMSYWRFAAIAFSGGLVWTTLFYVIGFQVGENWYQVATLLHRYGLYAGAGAGAIALVVWVIQYLRRPPVPPQGA